MRSLVNFARLIFQLRRCKNGFFMDTNSNKNIKKNSSPLDIAAEQWVNLVLAHITYKQTNKNNHFDKNKKEHKYGQLINI